MGKFGYFKFFLLLTFCVSFVTLSLHQESSADECDDSQRPGCPGFTPDPPPVNDNPNRRQLGDVLFLVDSSSYMQYSLDNRFTFGDGVENDETGGVFSGVTQSGACQAGGLPFKSAMESTKDVLRDFILEKSVNLGGNVEDVDFALARFPKTAQPSRTTGHYPVLCGGQGGQVDRLVEVGAPNFVGPRITFDSCPNAAQLLEVDGCVGGQIFLRARGEDPRFAETGLCGSPAVPNVLVGFPFQGWPVAENINGIFRWFDGFENSINRNAELGDFCRHSLAAQNERELEQNCELRANGRSSLGFGLKGVYDYFELVAQNQARQVCDAPKTVVVVTSTWEQCGEAANPDSPNHPIQVVQRLRADLGVSTYVLVLGGLADQHLGNHQGYDLQQWRERRAGLVQLAQQGARDDQGIQVPRAIRTEEDFRNSLEGIFADISTRVTREVCDNEDNDCDGFIDENVRNQCGQCIVRDGEGNVVNAPVERCNFIDDDCDGKIDEASDEEGNLYFLGDDRDLRNTCGNCVGREDLTAVEIQFNLRQMQLMDPDYNDCRANAQSQDDLNECERNFAPVDEGVCLSRNAACPDDLAELDDQSCGPCGSDGTLQCEGNVLVCVGATQPDENEGNACDNEDNDCDGFIDEGLDCFCVPEGAEECDGQDDDCDGRIDEESNLNQCGFCGPSPLEACNELDDDCDGQTDEGFELNACGECGEVPVEQCDGQDNDCDRAIDEAGCAECLDLEGNPREASDEVCDGQDNDCDGAVDEGGNALCNEGAPGPDRCGENQLGDIECIPSNEPVEPGAGGEPGDGQGGEPGAGGEPADGQGGAPDFGDICDLFPFLDQCNANPCPWWNFNCNDDPGAGGGAGDEPADPNPGAGGDAGPVDPGPGAGGDAGPGAGGDAGPVDPGPGAGGEAGAGDPDPEPDLCERFGIGCPPDPDPNPGAGGDAGPVDPDPGAGGMGQIPPGSDGGQNVDPGNPGAGGEPGIVDPGPGDGQGGLGQIPPGNDGGQDNPGDPGVGGDAGPIGPGPGAGGMGQIPPGNDGGQDNPGDPSVGGDAGPIGPGPGAGGEADNPGDPNPGAGGDAAQPGAGGDAAQPGAGGEDDPGPENPGPGDPDPIDECSSDEDCVQGETCVDAMCLTPEEEEAYRAARQKSSRNGCGCAVIGAVEESDQKGTGLLSLLVLLGLWRGSRKRK